MRPLVLLRPGLLATAFALTLSHPIGASAAIACRPGPMCPPQPQRGSPTSPRLPSNPSFATALGYFEVESPQCDPADIPAAIKGAEDAAVVDAQERLESQNIRQTSPFKVLSQDCRHSIYSGASKHLSWIVQVIANFER